MRSIVSFHHPDISLPVIRRRTTEALLDLLCAYGELALTRGWSAVRGNYFQTESAYYGALARLRKQGVIVDPGSGKLEGLESPDRRGTDRLNPTRWWRSSWDGVWYVLMYDVEERDRRVRNTLRAFLKRLRMGCLQRSVWVSWRDIRPEYHDLASTCGIESVSFLMEGRTVLGRDRLDVVRAAWDMRRVEEIHRWYLDVVGALEARLHESAFGRDELIQLADEELQALHVAFADDPLLPKVLLPANYLGLDVWRAHGRVVKAVKQALRQR